MKSIGVIYTMNVSYKYEHYIPINKLVKITTIRKCAADVCAAMTNIDVTFSATHNRNTIVISASGRAHTLRRALCEFWLNFIQAIEQNDECVDEPPAMDDGFSRVNRKKHSSDTISCVMTSKSNVMHSYQVITMEVPREIGIGCGKKDEYAA